MTVCISKAVFYVLHRATICQNYLSGVVYSKTCGHDGNIARDTFKSSPEVSEKTKDTSKL